MDQDQQHPHEEHNHTQPSDAARRAHTDPDSDIVIDPDIYYTLMHPMRAALRRPAPESE